MTGYYIECIERPVRIFKLFELEGDAFFLIFVSLDIIQQPLLVACSNLLVYIILIIVLRTFLVEL